MIDAEGIFGQVARKKTGACIHEYGEVQGDGEPRHCGIGSARSMQQPATFVERSECEGMEQSGSQSLPVRERVCMA